MKVVLLLTLLSLINCETFLRQTIANPGDSLCLNGQPAFFYLNQNHVKSTDHVLIHFMETPSASFCGDSSLASSLQACIALQTEISDYWKQTMTFNNTIFDSLDSQKWLKVIVPHCDGGLFQGYANQPTKYKNKDLYFRGNSIVKAIFASIAAIANLKSTTILSGSGLGAMGALIWSKWFQETYAMSSQARFKLVLDSIPRVYPSYKSGSSILQSSLQNMIKLVNIDQPHPFTVCAIRREGQEERCFFLDFNYNYFTFPTMVIQSQYDSYTIKKVLQISCVSAQGSLSGCSQAQRGYLEKYRSQSLITLFQFVNSNVGSSGQNSIWSIACSGRNFLLNSQWNRFKVQGKTCFDSFVSFSSNQRPAEYDKYSWPSNVECSDM